MTNSQKINVFMLVCVFVLAWLLFKDSCKGKPDTVNVQPVSVIRKQIVKDTLEEKRIRDSFSIVLNKEYKKDADNQKELDRLINENIELYNDSQDKWNWSSLADTCKPVVEFLTKRYDNYASQTQSTILQANKTIGGLNQTITSQKSAITQKDALYQKLRKDADSCLKTASALEKQKPRSYIYAGMHVLGEKNKILNGYGVELGLTNKRGTSYGISATNINSTINYGITIRKRLLKL